MFIRPDHNVCFKVLSEFLLVAALDSSQTLELASEIKQIKSHLNFSSIIKKQPEFVLKVCGSPVQPGLVSVCD